MSPLCPFGLSIMLLVWLLVQVGAQTLSSGMVNNTYFIIPVDTSVVRSIVPAEYPLLPVNSTILPGFPIDKRPVLVIGGTDYNISSTDGLFFFGNSRFHIPFVDRLNDGQTVFSYIPFNLNDNPAAVAATLISTGAIGLPAIINPPGILQEAAFVGPNEKLAFNSLSATGDMIDFEFFPSGTGPWPEQSYYALGSLPSFGPVSLTCYKHVETPQYTYAIQGTVKLLFAGLGLPSTSLNIAGFSGVKAFAEELLVDCTTF